MEKYHAFIRNKEYQIEIEGDQVFIDGEPVYLGIHFLNENGLFMVEKDKSKQEYHIKTQDDGTLRISTRGFQVDAIVESEKTRKKKQYEKKDNSTIIAPIPGIVMNVLIQEEDHIGKDQALIILESMKMLMEFRAPSSGIIDKIFVSEGQKLEKGQEMVKMIFVDE